jgi:hypothetical protein
MEKINFLAFFLPIIIFLFWGTIGFATLSILRSQRTALQNMLLAPSIGIAITLLPVFWLNRLGIPVGSFATVLSISLLTTSIIIIFRQKPLFSLYRYLPFASILCLALYLVGHSLLKYGFDWVSYSNDDMANYCLAALRFLQHGFYEIPSVNSLVLDKDYSLNYWFMHVPGLARPGSELLLAWISGITHLKPLQIFMPTIVALNLCLVSAVGALSYQSNRCYYIALTSCLLLTFSALTVLGTFYQLIAQVGGLSLLTSTVLLLLQPFSICQKYISLRSGVLLAITGSALLICYPEVLPFLLLSFILYIVVNLFQGWKPSKSFFASILIGILTTIIALNYYLASAGIFLYKQSSNAVSFYTYLDKTSHGHNLSTCSPDTQPGDKVAAWCKRETKGSLLGRRTTEENETVGNKKPTNSFLFPYYLLPSGLANFWGIAGINENVNTVHYPSQEIALGLMLSILAILSILWLVWQRRQPAATVALIMFFLGLYLYIKRLDFGLFKIVMYIQPFLLSVLAIIIFKIVKNPYLRSVPIIILILCNLSGINTYADRSSAQYPGGLTEIAYASSSKINQEFQQLIAKIPLQNTLVLDGFNVSLLKFLGFNSQGRETHYLVYPVMEHMKNLTLPPKWLLSKKDTEQYKMLVEQLDEKYKMQYFFLHDIAHPTSSSYFLDLKFNVTDLKHTFLIANTYRQSVVNRWRFNSANTNNFSIIPWQDVHNHLVFINSEKGPIYFAPIYGSTETTSFFNLEDDIIYQNQSMIGIGRYLLFRVINPTKSIRLFLDITNTFTGNKGKPLPPVAVIGEKRVPIFILGQGAARVISLPILPQIINGKSYIAIDMGDEGALFKDRKKGLMKLYGKSVPVDRRKIVAFSRGIALISNEQYRSLTPPCSISQFPTDLKNPDLEYSGIFEDGWISKAAFFNFTQPAKKANLVIKGTIQPIYKNLISTQLTVYLDGKKLIAKNLSLGNFLLLIPISDYKTHRKVELHFSKIQILPDNDERPVAAKMQFIGFEEPQRS